MYTHLFFIGKDFSYIYEICNKNLELSQGREKSRKFAWSCENNPHSYHICTGNYFAFKFNNHKACSLIMERILSEIDKLGQV